MLKTAKLAIKNNISGKYLFVLRENKPNIPNPNRWDIVGGMVEMGEKPKIAALREMVEEVGDLDVYDVRFIKKWKVYKMVEGVNRLTEFWIYFAKTAKSLDQIQVRSEGQRAGYFSLDEILKLDTDPLIKEFIHTYKEIIQTY